MFMNVKKKNYLDPIMSTSNFKKKTQKKVMTIVIELTFLTNNDV